MWATSIDFDIHHIIIETEKNKKKYSLVYLERTIIKPLNVNMANIFLIKITIFS